MYANSFGKAAFWRFFYLLHKEHAFAYNKKNILIIGGTNVKASILKAMQYGQIVDVMYMAKNGEITKRRMKVLKITGDSFQAYCFLRNTKRTFKVDNVLSLIPVTRKESAVI